MNEFYEILLMVLFVALYGVAIIAGAIIEDRADKRHAEELQKAFPIHTRKMSGNHE